jgi:hypothetical protein
MKRIPLNPGDRFGLLVVIREVGTKKYPGAKDGRGSYRAFLCQCDCGKKVETSLGHLRSGHTRSCGCAKSANKITELREYKVWQSMKQRCSNPKNRKYENYGGRGIQICDRWTKSFRAFYEDMGGCPEGMSIDRIDNNGNYEPSNCRWATPSQQMNNTRAVKFIAYKGESLSISEWARRLNVDRSNISRRLSAGETGDSIIQYYMKRLQLTLNTDSL